MEAFKKVRLKWVLKLLWNKTSLERIEIGPTWQVFFDCPAVLHIVWTVFLFFKKVISIHLQLVSDDNDDYWS